MIRTGDLQIQSETTGIVTYRRSFKTDRTGDVDYLHVNNTTSTATKVCELIAI